MKLHLENLVKAGSKLWLGSDMKGSYVPPEYEIEQGPQKGKKIPTKNMMCSCWMKETGAMASVNEIVGTMKELNIDPSIPYTMNPKLKKPTLDDTAEIVLSYEKYNLRQKESNAYYVKEAAAKAAALKKEQVADTGDTGGTKGNDKMDVDGAGVKGGADGKKDSAKAAADSTSLLSPVPSKGAAPTIGKANAGKVASSKKVTPKADEKTGPTTNKKTGSTTNKPLIPKKRSRDMGEKGTPKKELDDDELEDMSDEEKPNIAAENFAWFCDKCKLAGFRTRDKAEAHEETCTGVFDPTMFPNAPRRKKKKKVKASDKKK